MPVNVSSDQDQLVRQLTEMQKEDETAISREGKLLNTGLFVGVLITGGMLFFANFSTTSLLTTSVGITVLLTLIALLLGMFGLKFSRLVISFMFFFFTFLAIFLLYFINPFVRELVIFIYALFLFAIAAQYSLKGYIVSAVIFASSEIYFQINSGFSIEKLHSLILTILIVCTIGLIPVLIYRITKVNKETELQKVRLQILAVQNQNLVNSWQEYFTKKSRG